MATAGQYPVNCRLCSLQRGIKWKCLDCEMLLCENCRSNVHLRDRDAKNHKVINIKDIGRHPVLTLTKEFEVKISDIAFLCKCPEDNSFWIASGSKPVVYKIEHEGSNANMAKVITKLDVAIYGMAFTTSNDLLLSVKEQKLKLYSSTTGKLTDSVYDVSPLQTSSLHVSNDGTVIVGAGRGSDGGEHAGRRSVIVLNKNGETTAKFEKDKNNKNYLRYAFMITSTENGNIFVVDKTSSNNDTGRVVVFDIKEKDIVSVYSGDPTINTEDNPFYPFDLATTSLDNVIVADAFNHVFHILNNVGNPLTICKNVDIGIPSKYFAFALDFVTENKLIVGSAVPVNSTYRAKIFILNISGC